MHDGYVAVVSQLLCARVIISKILEHTRLYGVIACPTTLPECLRNTESVIVQINLDLIVECLGRRAAAPTTHVRLLVRTYMSARRSPCTGNRATTLCVGQLVTSYNLHPVPPPPQHHLTRATRVRATVAEL
jgi:hypothetical protein